MGQTASEIPPALGSVRPPPLPGLGDLEAFRKSRPRLRADRLRSERSARTFASRTRASIPPRRMLEAGAERFALIRFTVLLLGRPALHLRVPTSSVRLLWVVLVVAPLFITMSGFAARSAYEFPEIQAMREDVASPFASGSRAAFAFEPSMQHVLWNSAPEDRAVRLGLGTVPVASQLLAARPDPAWVAAASELAAVPETLQWPVPEGWFVRGYGSGEGGYHRAVDVAAEPGSEVVAAAPGIVGYVGNQIRGYGNIVLLVHPGGAVTLYAHNEKNLVVAGQAVHAGEQIATVGSTGISRGPHVHFEFLHDGQNCDPNPLFRPFVRHRSGAPSETPQLDWNLNQERPRGVRCGRRLRHPSYHGEEEGLGDAE